MFNVLLCLTTKHDWRLVLVAAVICMLATSATFFLYSRLPASTARKRWAWLTLIGFVAGSGIWTTHFVAMLAFQTGLPSAFALTGTFGSLAVAILCTTMGFGVSSAKSPFIRQELMIIAGGLAVGLGITLMHYVGMSGYRTTGEIIWSRGFVAASVVLGALFASAALYVARPGSRFAHQAVGAGLLTLGIVGMHFTGMTAVTIFPDPNITVAASSISKTMMGSLAVMVTMFILFAAVGGVLLDSIGRRSLRSLRAAFDAMSDGLAFFDRADRLMAWNEQYASLCTPWGVTLEVGMPNADLLKALAARGAFPEAIGREAEWLAERRLRRENAGGGAEQLTADGKWIRISDRPTADGGIVTVYVDITDLKSAEVDMAQARDEAEAANRAKSEFLANMSHEIRTPLNGVLGMAQVIAMDELSPLQRERLGVVRSSGESLLSLLNDVLDLSKIEAGKLTIECIDFDLAQEIQAVLAQNRALAANKGLAIEAVIDGAEGLYQGDPYRIRQIIQNLVSNAIKFTDSGSISVTASADAEGLKIKVLDTGMGIPPDKIDTIFQKFRQVDESTTRRFGGTGLGLSICRELAQAMGGDVSVQSREGEGSIFTLALPLRLSARNPANMAASGPAYRQPELGLRVLAAEDNPTNQLVLKALLATAGITPTIVFDGAAAVTAWRNGDWDVILMDVHMPVMDGLTAVKEIRRAEAQSGAAPTRIVALTADAMDHRVREYLDAGMDDYLAKPISIERLFAVLSDVQAAAELAVASAEATLAVDVA